MKILSIDPSLTDTGVCVLSGIPIGPLAEPLQWKVNRVKSKPSGSGYARVFDRINHIVNMVDVLSSDPPDPALIMLERPALSRNTGHAHDRAGLWWLLYRMLAEEFSPELILCPEPNLRPKYATGRGNASKDEVMAAAIKRYGPMGAEITNNNEADAVVQAAMGARLLGYPIESSLPKTHLDALRTLSPPMKGNP